MFKSKVDEAAYIGNIGMMELIKFHKNATAEQKKKLQQHIANRDKKKAWKTVQNVTGVKLHKSVNEKQEFVSKAGAGEEGRSELVNKYKKDTPGQNIASFKDHLKTKY